MGRMSRRKGHNWERQVARDLTEATGVDYKRNLTETRDGNSGDVLPDLAHLSHPIAVGAIHRTGRGGEKLAVLSWDDFLELASALPGYDFVVQCKCGARPNVFAALEEAADAT